MSAHAHAWADKPKRRNENKLNESSSDQLSYSCHSTGRQTAGPVNKLIAEFTIPKFES